MNVIFWISPGTRLYFYDFSILLTVKRLGQPAFFYL